MKSQSMRPYSRGVTLMELIVVVMIIGVLSTIAVPTYRNYVIRANRTDAKAAVMSMASALERCYTRFNSYNNAGCTVDILNVQSPDGHYLVSTTFPGGPPAGSANSFLITAVPQAAQAKDAECGSFTLTEANVKGVASAKKAAPDCWGR